MTQPPVYERQFDFTDYSAAHPSNQQPGTFLDAELNAIKETLDAVRVSLMAIQRDDLAVGNNTIGPDQLVDDLVEQLSGQDGEDGGVGPPGPALVVGLFVDLDEKLIPIGTDVLHTSGYSTKGIGRAVLVSDDTINAAEVAAHPRCCAITANGRGFRLPLDGSAIDFEAFGAIPDNATDAYPAFQAMQAYGLAHLHAAQDPDFVQSFKFSVRVNGRYYSSENWSLHGCQALICDFGSGMAGGGHPAQVRFAADKYGVIINRHNTDGDQKLANFAKTGADGTIIRGITFVGDGTDTLKHGIWVRAKATFVDVSVDGFPGNNWNIVASAGSGALGTNYLEGNANSSVFERCAGSASGRHGFYVDGSDANAMQFYSCNVLTAAGGAFVDGAFLGNTYMGPSSHGCGSASRGGCSHGGNRYGLVSTDDGTGVATTPGTNNFIWRLLGAGGVTTGYPAWDAIGPWFTGSSFLTDNANNRGVFVNPYIEGGGYISQVVTPAMVVAPNLVSSFTQDTPMAASFNGTPVAFGGPLGVGSFRNLAAGGYHYNNMGGADSQLYISGGSDRVDLRRIYDGRDTYLTWLNGGSTIAQITRGFSTIAEFGTGAAQPYSYHIIKFMLGPDANTARRIDLLTAAPAANAHASGEFVFNSTAAGSQWAWRCTAGGTPGTWEALYRRLYGSATWDPGSIAAAGNETKTITVTGAATGDIVTGLDFGGSIQPLVKNAWVSAANTVTAELLNLTAGAIDLGSMTVKVEVTKQ